MIPQRTAAIEQSHPRRTQGRDHRRGRAEQSINPVDEMQHCLVRPFSRAFVAPQHSKISYDFIIRNRACDNAGKTRGISDTEVRTLTCQRMYAVRRIANQHQAR